MRLSSSWASGRVAIKGHSIYPYPLRNVDVAHKNQVWCADITYLGMGSGFLYLVAIMDWYTRYVLSWRISNALDGSFCIEALEEAGPPGDFQRR
ncbi:MAG: hypothetical protein D6722_19125 [Bacteroidetes bacterium]|nr:MAG: hypothetical protein D6722_19125 [Bacteroidota bacterium]